MVTRGALTAINATWMECTTSRVNYGLTIFNSNNRRNDMATREFSDDFDAVA